MSIKRIQVNQRLSQAVVHENTVYLVGQVPTTGSTIEEQTASVLKAIDDLLSASGSDKSLILRATIWLADRNDFDGLNTVWDQWVDKNNPPVRSTCQVNLLSPDHKVEITVTAALP